MQQIWINSKDLKKQSNQQYQPWPSFATDKEKRIEKKSSWGERFFNGGTIWLSKHTQECQVVNQDNLNKSKRKEKNQI